MPEKCTVLLAKLQEAAIDRAIYKHECLVHKQEVSCSMLHRDFAGYDKAKKEFQECE